jgi:hypothetical protein
METIPTVSTEEIAKYLRWIKKGKSYMQQEGYERLKELFASNTSGFLRADKGIHRDDKSFLLGLVYDTWESVEKLL